VQLPARPPAADEPLGVALEGVVDGVLAVATVRGRQQFEATARAWELRRYEFVDAITPDTLPRSNADGHLTLGERCVKASMRKALKTMLSRNWSTSIVFESDAFGSGPALAARLRSAFDAQRRYAPSAGVLWLGRCYARGCFEDRRVGGDVFETRWSLCLHAFAVLSPAAARRAIDVLTPGACALVKCPADVAIASLALASPPGFGLAVWPAILQQNRSLPSEVKFGALDRLTGVKKAGSNFVRHLYQTECADAELRLPEIKGFARTQRRLLQQPMPPASTIAPEWAAARNVDVDVWHNSELGTDPRVVAAFVESNSVAERRERLLAAPASASLPLKRWWCRSVGAVRANATGAQGYWKPHVAKAVAAAARARRGDWREATASRRAIDAIGRDYGLAWVVARPGLRDRCARA